MLTNSTEQVLSPNNTETPPNQLKSDNYHSNYDARADVSQDKIIYKFLHKFRIKQQNMGIDLTSLNNEQWGLVHLPKCHHISTTSVSKDGPQSYRVRICKTCCQETSHIELGTYLDQESAILVNDSFEILNGRFSKLNVLRACDQEHLNLLMIRKHDRACKQYMHLLLSKSGEGSLQNKEIICILDLLSDRLANIADGKKRRMVSQDGVMKERYKSSSTRSNTCSSSSTSSDTSDEISVKNGLIQGGEKTNENKDSEKNSFIEGQKDQLVTIKEECELAIPPKQVNGLLKLKKSVIKLQPHVPDTYELLDDTMKELKETSKPIKFVQRPRSLTFSSPLNPVEIPLSTQDMSLMGNKQPNPIAMLTWLASLGDEEVAVAKSLFELSNAQFEASDLGSPNPKQDYEKTQNRLQSNQQVIATYEGKKQKIKENQTGLLSNEKNEQSMTIETVEDNSCLDNTSGHFSPMEVEADPIFQADFHPGSSYSQKFQFQNRETYPRKLGSGRARSNSLPINLYNPKEKSNNLGLESETCNRQRDAMYSLALRKFNESAKREGFIGIYSPEDRKLRISRFIEKRKHRMWCKKVKYDVRKNFADSRVRVKGRFVKKGFGEDGTPENGSDDCDETAGVEVAGGEVEVAGERMEQS